jgi:outer membrane protein assembly factor BamB
MDAVKAWEYVTRGHVLDVSISASGELIVAGSQDAYLYMFDKTGRALWGQNLGTPVLRACISPNGEYIATSTYDNILSFFSKTGALLWRRRVNRPVMGIDMTLDGNYVAMGSDNRNVYVVAANGALIWNQKVGGEIRHVVITRDGRYTITGSYDAFIYCFDHSGNLYWSYKTMGPIEALAINGSADNILASSSDHRTYFLNRSGSMIWNPKTTDTVRQLAISDQGNLMVQGMGPEVSVLGKDGQVTHRWKAESPITALALAESGEYVTVGTQEGKVFLLDKDLQLLWDFATGGEITSLGISEKGHFIVAGSKDRKVYMFDNHRYFDASVEEAKKVLDNARAFGLNVLEAEVLLQKAEGELSKEDYGAAAKYAEAATKVASRLLQKAQPEMSVLGVVHESFSPGQATDIKAIIMNTGQTHAFKVTVTIEGGVRVAPIEAVESLGVNEFVNRNFNVTTVGPGDVPIKVIVHWTDKAGRALTTEGTFNLKSLEAKKPLPKNQPVVSIGNVQKLVQKVAASKMGKGDAKMAAEVAKNRCPRCGKLLMEDWTVCPRCQHKLK